MGSNAWSRLRAERGRGRKGGQPQFLVGQVWRCMCWLALVRFRTWFGHLSPTAIHCCSSLRHLCVLTCECALPRLQDAWPSGRPVFKVPYLLGHAFKVPCVQGAMPSGCPTFSVPRTRVATPPWCYAFNVRVPSLYSYTPSGRHAFNLPCLQGALIPCPRGAMLLGCHAFGVLSLGCCSKVQCLQCYMS
jgi:hypothetical protein